MPFFEAGVYATPTETWMETRVETNFVREFPIHLYRIYGLADAINIHEQLSNQI